MEDHNTRIVVVGRDPEQARAVAEAIAREAFHNVSYFPGSYRELAATVPQAHIQSEDEKAVRSLVLARIEEFNRHEGPEPGAFTEDADFINAYGMWRRGPAEIEARQKERMGSILKDAKNTLLDLRIRFVKPDVAIVHQLHEMSGMRDAAGKSLPAQKELGVRVMVKERGKWLTTAFHNTIVRPDSVASPALPATH
jgi:uncharacterized protein (TIGR02246 family)